MQSHQQQVCVLMAPCTAAAVGRDRGSNSSSYGSWACQGLTEFLLLLA